MADGDVLVALVAMVAMVAIVAVVAVVGFVAVSGFGGSRVGSKKKPRWKKRKPQLKSLNDADVSMVVAEVRDELREAVSRALRTGLAQTIGVDLRAAAAAVKWATEDAVAGGVKQLVEAAGVNKEERQRAAPDARGSSAAKDVAAGKLQSAATIAKEQQSAAPDARMKSAEEAAARDVKSV